MLISLLTAATAATLTVGPTGTYPSVSDAVAVAVDGDVLLVEPGTYTESFLVEVDLSIVGSAPGVLIVSDGVGDEVIGVRDASLTLTDLEIDGDGAAEAVDGLNGVGDIVLRRAVVRNGDGIVSGVDGGSTGRVWIEDCTFEGNEGAQVVGNAAELVVLRSTFQDNRATAVALIDGDLVQDSVFLDNDAAISSTARNGGVRPRILGNRFLDNTFGVAISGDNKAGGSLALLRGNLFQGGGTALSIQNGRDCTFYGCDPAEVSKVTVLQNTFVDTALAVDLRSGIVAGLADNAFMNNQDALRGIWDVPYTFPGDVEPEIVQDHNLFFSNGTDIQWIGSGVVLTPPSLGSASLVGVDPLYTTFTDNGQWVDDDFTPLAGSPLVDGGHPRISDPDGTVSDIGHHTFAP